MYYYKKKGCGRNDRRTNSVSENTQMGKKLNCCTYISVKQGIAEQMDKTAKIGQFCKKLYGG